MEGQRLPQRSPHVVEGPLDGGVSGVLLPRSGVLTPMASSRLIASKQPKPWNAHISTEKRGGIKLIVGIFCPLYKVTLPSSTAAKVHETNCSAKLALIPGKRYVISYIRASENWQLV